MNAGWILTSRQSLRAWRSHEGFLGAERGHASKDYSGSYVKTDVKEDKDRCGRIVRRLLFRRQMLRLQ